MEDEIREIYYDPKTGYVSAKAIHKKLNGKYTLKQIKDFISKQEVNQLHTQENDKKQYFPIVGDSGSYQADLTFYEQYKKSNKGYWVLLTCVNITTRKAYVKPLKNKTEINVIESFKDIILQAGDMKTLTTDNGSEFKKNFTAMLKKNGIEHVLVDAGDKNKMGKIERFNRTLREKIEKYLTANHTNKYIDVLDDLVEGYNNTEHSSIGIEPNQVDEKKEKEIHQDESERILEVMPKMIFNEGDKVRLLKPKEVFEKKSGERYYRGVYEIVKKNAMSYKLKNYKGEVLTRRAKHYELVKVDDIQKPDIEKEVDRDIEVKQHKVNKALKKEGINEENIVKVSRRAKKVDGLDVDNIIVGKRTRK